MKLRLIIRLGWYLEMTKQKQHSWHRLRENLRLWRSSYRAVRLRTNARFSSQAVLKPAAFVDVSLALKIRDQCGSLLGAVLVVTLSLSIIGLSLITLVLSDFEITTKNVSDANALLVAEAGIEQSLQQLNTDDNFAGYPSAQEFFNNPDQGRASFETVVEDTADSNAKTITSVGKVYRLNDADNPVSTRTVKVTVVGTGSEGYSVFSGPGGLILGGSANITNSDVFVNGTISMNGAARIGTPSQPVNVAVAHQACPTGTNPGNTYPTVCNSGQPISLQQSTFIYGTVCATNQTSTGPNPAGNIQAGNGGEGLQPNCTTAPGTQPSYDRAAHIARMTTTGSASNITYNCSQWQNPNGFTRTWPANLQLNGSVSATSSCDLTISGDVYITGNLTIGGAARIRVAESVGQNRPRIVVDGSISVGGSAQLIANSSGTGVQFISYRSNAPCNPSCTEITGTALKNTQNLQTISVGGAANMPGMIFQAYWGRITVTGSGNIGSAVGQTVDLSGAGTITFGTELSSGAKTWTITSYQQKFD